MRYLLVCPGNEQVAEHSWPKHRILGQSPQVFVDAEKRRKHWRRLPGKTTMAQRLSGDKYVAPSAWSFEPGIDSPEPVAPGPIKEGVVPDSLKDYDLEEIDPVDVNGVTYQAYRNKSNDPKDQEYRPYFLVGKKITLVLMRNKKNPSTLFATNMEKMQVRKEWFREKGPGVLVQVQ